jgi:adenosylcobinamide kinase / adenosylcobinamide-phosphate guanylyltransferase
VTLVVLLGGARSGKSALAVRLAGEAGAPVTFLATGEAGDDEMAERISRHRAERPKDWATVEEPLELLAAIERVRGADTLVVDCLSLWVANVLERESADAVDDQALTAARAAAARAGLTVAVSNEVGLGVVPPSPAGRRYRDVLGRVNATWVAAADKAVLVVAGRALLLDPADQALR